MPGTRKRPAGPSAKTRRCTITLTARTDELLALYARRRQCTRSELVERITAAWLRQQADPGPTGGSG